MGTLGYCRLDHNNSSDAHSSPPFQTSFSNVLAFTNIYIYNIYIYACIYIICIGVYKSSGQIIALHYTRTEQKQEIGGKKKRKHRRLFTSSSLEQKLAATAHSANLYKASPTAPGRRGWMTPACR